MGVFPETINDPKFVRFIYFFHTEHLRIFFVTLLRLYTLFLLQSNYIILLKEQLQIELS